MDLSSLNVWNRVVRVGWSTTNRPYVCIQYWCVLEFEGVICVRCSSSYAMRVQSHPSIYTTTVAMTAVVRLLSSWNVWNGDALGAYEQKVRLYRCVFQFENVVGIRHSMRS